MSCSIKMSNFFRLNVRNFEKTVKRFSSFNISKTEDLIVKNLNGKYDGVVVFGMNRPERKNALGVNLVDHFDRELDRVNYEAKARILVIKSLVRGVFCSGADLKERRNMSSNEITKFLCKLRTVLNKIAHLPIPVIASMDGAALGGGLELALACDLRITSSCAKLALLETKLAIIPGAGGTQRLPRLINPAKAKELIFTGDVIDGKRAEELGMVNYALEQNENGDISYMKSLEICEKLLQNGPIALKMAKVSINRGLETDINTGLAIEEACYAQLIPTKDREEALKAFELKKKPNFKGE